LADELIRFKVDVLFTPAGDEALAAKKATKTIPIVFAGVADPVAIGLVDSLARPGGNVTGFSTIAPVLAGKRLELLKETIPRLSRVAVLWDPKSSASAQSWKESQLAARELGVHLYSTEVSNADRFDGAFQEAIKAGSGVLTVIPSPLVNTNQKRIADLALKHRLPAIYPREDFADSGGLMSYGPDRTEPYRRAAVYVDKILKGTKPAELPVEQPTKFEFIINLKAAKQIGLTIPPSVSARADKVIR
jgi:putative ABC transport system substrate-binding protein